MSPLTEIGSYSGVLARCDVCGAASPYLGGEGDDLEGYVINDDGSARWAVDGWLLIYPEVGKESAAAYCPAHLTRGAA